MSEIIYIHYKERILAVNLPTMFQDVFLMIRRHKTTIFTDAKESTTVYELKRIVEGILKRAPEDQRLYKVSSDGCAVNSCVQLICFQQRVQLEGYFFILTISTCAP